MLNQQNIWYWARTMRTEDLLDGYISALDDMKDADDVVFAADDAEQLLAQLRAERDKLDDDERDHSEMEYTSFLLEQASDAINQALPEDYYWGLDPNDPSYGGVMWHYECIACMRGIETEHRYVAEL